MGVSMISTVNPTAFSKFTTKLVFSIWYSGWVVPSVSVMMIPNSQINTVRQTSANERDTGEIFFERVTAMGTEIAIEMISPTLRRVRRRLLPN